MAANEYPLHLHRSSQAIEDDRQLADLLADPAETLPPDIADFAGRQAEMQQAVALVQQLRRQNSARVLAIVGSAGVGKSAFALHLAHQLRASFAHAPIYLSLQRRPLPASLPHQAAQRDRPLLIVLDDLQDAAQMRPLLALDCIILVTSRQPIEATATLALPALSESDAIALLQTIATSKTVQAEATARSIVQLCDSLPLPLRLVAGVLHQPLQLADCLQQLTEARQRCEQANPAQAAIRASFNLSYAHLDGRSARLLRQLGLLSEPTVTLKTAAALLDDSIDVARASVAHLLRVRLLDVAGKERYRLPDALRRLVKAQLAIEESTEARQSARLQLAQAYQETAEITSWGFDASRRQQIVQQMQRYNRRASLEQNLLLNAQTWFEAERLNLLAAVDWAVQAQAWPIALALISSLTPFLHQQNDWETWETIYPQAIAAAEMRGDRLQVAQLLNSSASAHLRQGNLDQAKAQYEQSLEILRQQQEPVKEAQTLANLGIVYAQQEKFEAAVTLWTTALALLPAGSTIDRTLRDWMQAVDRSLFEAVLLQLDDRLPSRNLLGAIGGMFKWMIS